MTRIPLPAHGRPVSWGNGRGSEGILGGWGRLSGGPYSRRAPPLPRCRAYGPRHDPSRQSLPPPSLPDLPVDAVERIRIATIDSQSEGHPPRLRLGVAAVRGLVPRSGYQALPAHPTVIAAYLVDAAETVDENGERAYSTQSLGKWSSAIFDRHRRAGVDLEPSGARTGAPDRIWDPAAICQPR